jgi:hypothetical protein
VGVAYGNGGRWEVGSAFLGRNSKGGGHEKKVWYWDLGSQEDLVNWDFKSQKEPSDRTLSKPSHLDE